MLSLALWQCSVLPTHRGNLLCPSAHLLQPSIKYFSENSLLIPNSSYNVRKSSLFDYNMSRLNSFQCFVFLTEIRNVTFFRLPHSTALWNTIFRKILKIDFVCKFFICFRKICAKHTQNREVFLSVCPSTYCISDPAEYFWLQRSSALLLHPNRYSLHNKAETRIYLLLRGQSLKFLIFGCNSLVGVQDEGYKKCNFMPCR